MTRHLQASAKRTAVAAVVLAALTTFTALPGHAAIVGSATPVSFAAGSTSFSYGGATWTLIDNGTVFPDPVSIATAGGAQVRTIFGQPSVDFQTTIVYDNNFIQYAAFAQPTVMRFTATPSSLGLRVTLADGDHFGYALFSGTLLQSYGFETMPNVGILSGAPITPVPEPATTALLLAGLVLVGSRVMARR